MSENNLLIPRDARTFPLVQFSDGEHVIPVWVVDFIGYDELEQMKAGLADVAYDAFMSEVNRLKEGKYLNDFQRQFVGNFLKKR